MRKFYTICFCLIVSFEASAQSSADTTYRSDFIPNSKEKAIVHLMNNSTVSGTIVKITDSVMVLSIPAQNPPDSNNVMSIAIPEIQTIKIKRNAFWLGMVSGATGGALVGYGLGYITYSNNSEISDIGNKDNQKARGAVGAVIVAAPGAVIGSVVGAIGTKRNFVIDGKNENIRKMIKSLWELQ